MASATLVLLSLAPWSVLATHAQTAAIKEPTLVLAEDGCTPSRTGRCPLFGKNCPDPGDTLDITTLVANSTGATAAFRVVFHAESDRGGPGANQLIDLLDGGPGFPSFPGASGGITINTPQVLDRLTYTVHANFSLHRSQLTDAMNLAPGQSAILTIRADLFNEDETVLFASATHTQVVENRAAVDCTLAPDDASPTVLDTDRVRYNNGDPITIEWAPLGADPALHVPTWINGVTGSIQVVRMDTLPSGDPATDLADNAGNIEQVLQIPSGAAAPACSPPCAAATTAAAVNSNNLTPNHRYLLCLDPNASGSSQDPVTAPQCTYLELGTVAPLPVTLAFFSSSTTGSQTTLHWQTATEAGTVGFYLYADHGAGPQRINPRLVPSRAIHSTRPQNYEYSTEVAPSVTAFFVEDLDLRGHATRHGPFITGRTYGARVQEAPIDWPAVRVQHRAHLTKRQAAARTRVRSLLRSTTAPRARILVTQTGLQRVSYEQLLAAGVDLSNIPLRRLALTNGRRKVPIYIGASPSNRDFGPGDFVEFYGTAADSLYTRTNVYLLRVRGRRVRHVRRDRRRAGRKAKPPLFYMETVTVNRDRKYSFAAPGPDPWYDTGLLAFTSPVRGDFDAVLDHYIPGVAPVTLAVEMWGETAWPSAPDHHVVVEFNGTPVADEVFDGLVTHPVRTELPAGSPREGANTVTLRLPGDSGVAWDLVNLDRYSVTYPRAFVARKGRLEFTAKAHVLTVRGLPDPDIIVYRMRAGRLLRRVERLAIEAEATGTYAVTFRGSPREATYVVSTTAAITTPAVEAAPDAVDLTSGQADLLVISHPDFIAALAPLVAAHRAEGLGVRVVSVDDVYDRYSAGVVEATAIRDYISAATKSMGVRYVLLVGADTYDYLDRLGYGALSFLPSLYERTGPIVRWAPVDPLYGDVDFDGVPDVPVGRLPVRTTAELDRLVEKTLAHQSTPYEKSAIFAADDGSAWEPFSAMSEAMVATLPTDWQATRAYLDDLDLPTSRNVLLNAINSGAALTNFVGHSGPTRWTFDGLFTSSDAAALANGGHPTVVTQFGCWTAYDLEPASSTLARALLVSGQNGAAAVLGSVTLTEAAAQAELGKALLPRLTQPGTRIGDALLAAKREMVAAGTATGDILAGWTILGDPTLMVSR